MNSNGLITRCVVPSRHGVLSLSSTCPAALSCTRFEFVVNQRTARTLGLKLPQSFLLRADRVIE
jgi:hypothetical protein